MVGSSASLRQAERRILALLSVLLLTSSFLAAAGPAAASLGFDNARMADIALGYVGQPGVNACLDAGKGTAYAGQCKQFVNCIIVLAGGPMPAGGPDYAGSFIGAGGTEVSELAADKGDIIQWGSETTSAQHTAIVVANLGGSRFEVVDSNWGSPGLTVKRHIIANIHADLFNGKGAQPTRFIRMGAVVAVSPFGSLDEASSPSAGVLRVAGWSADPDAPTQSIDVHVYVNDTFLWGGTANQRRDDVAGAYPGYGSSHGFSADVSLSAGGSYRVCAYGINVGGGSNKPLGGCKQVQVTDPQPFGFLDRVSSSTPGTVAVEGWAVDPSNPRASIEVHAYIDQKFLGATTANQRRDDVDKALSGYGALHGYVARFAASAGTHRVCTYAINIGVGDNRQLKECKNVTVAAPPAPDPAPVQAPAPGVDPAPAAVPAAPGSLTTSRVRSPRRGVTILSWAPATNATSYRFRISWPNRSKRWTRWATTPNTWMKVTRLHRGAKYRFQVQAVSSGGQSAVKQWRFVQRR